MGTQTESLDRIECALAALEPAVMTMARQGHWRLVVANGVPLDLEARVADGWLELSVPLPDLPLPEQRPLWTLLRTNAGLRGPVCVGRKRTSEAAHLRADLFINEDAPGSDRTYEAGCGDEQAGLPNRIRVAWADLRRAFHVLTDAAVDGHPGEADRDVPDPNLRLTQLCEAAGWPCTARAAGGVTVTLDSNAEYRARLDLDAGHALHAAVDLVDLSSRSDLSRDAIALLLFGASAIVRSVKGSLETRDGVDMAALAAACERPASATVLDRALSALTIACRYAGREVQALSDEHVARQYVALRARRGASDLAETAGSAHEGVRAEIVMEAPQETMA